MSVNVSIESVFKQISEWFFWVTALEPSEKTARLAEIRLKKEIKPTSDGDVDAAQVLLLRRAQVEIQKIISVFRLSISAISSRELQEFHWVLKLETTDLILLLGRYRSDLSLNRIGMALGVPTGSLEERIEVLNRRFSYDFPGTSLSAFLELPIRDLKKILSASNATQLSVENAWLKKRQSLSRALILETSVTLVVMMVFAFAVPKVREIYERNMESKLNRYLVDHSITDSPYPESLKRAEPVILPDEPAPSELIAEPKIAPERASKNRKEPKVNPGETWRFSFAGGVPDRLRPAVMEMLNQENIKMDRPSTVPGGTQYDVLVPVNKVIAFKRKFEDLASDPEQNKQAKPVNLSWYKKRNIATRRIPDQHVQMIIWVSTL